MPLPADLYDEDANYRLRICIKIDDDPIIGLLTGSKVHTCDGCGAAIWVHEEQPIPEADVPITGDLKVCTDCGRDAIEMSPHEEKWLGPKPADWS